MSKKARKKARRIRCANPECGKQVRPSRATRKYCSPKCKQAVFEQRKRADAQVAAEKEAAAEAKAAADVKAETDAKHERIINNKLADRKRKADAEARAREQEATEQKEAETRERTTRKGSAYTPAAPPITVHLGPVPKFRDIATPLPPDQRSPWR